MKRIVAAALAVLVAPQLFAQAIRVDSSTIPRPPAPQTATRVDSAPAGRMFSTSVITADDLRRRGIVSLADALRLVAGAAVVQPGAHGSETSLFLRGGEGDYVVFLLDGIRINDTGGAISLAFVPIANIDRIEIVRGPVSALYGSGAVSGVVQIFTKKAGKERTSEVATSWGPRGTRNSEISFVVAGPKSRYSLGAAKLRAKGDSGDNNRSWTSSYSGTAEFELGRNTVVHLNGRYTDGHYRFPVGADGPVAAPDLTAQIAERRLAAGAGVTWRLSKDLDAIIDASYMRRRAGSYDEATLTPGIAFTGENVRRSAGARVNFHGWNRTVVTGGLEYELQHNSIEGQSVAFDPDRRTQSAYGQLLARSDKDFEIAFGARVDDSDLFGQHTTWRVGAGTPLGRTTRLRGSIGTAFREPQYLPAKHENEILVHPGELIVEQSRTWEAGVEQAFAQTRLVFSATYFHQSFVHMVSFVGDLSDGGFENADQAFANGWELGMRADVSNALRISSSATMLDARFEGTGPNAGSHLLRRPSLLGNASLVWQANRNFSLSSDVSYVGRRSDNRFYAPQPERMGGYAKVDISGEFVAPKTNATDYPLMLTLRVDNALNRKYATVVGFPATSRRFSIGARLLVAY